MNIVQTADDRSNPQKNGNPRAAQVRIKGKTAKSVGGQRAHDLRIGPQPTYVDANRTHLNRVLITPQTGTQLRKVCEERRAMRLTVRAMKSSAAVGTVGIITFGHEAQKIFEALTPVQQDAAYRETAEAIAKRLNTTLTGLVVHGDESAPHAHLQLPAYDLTGHPISETAKRGALRNLQTITAEVMGRHAPGIERGRSKLDRLKAGATPAEVVNRSVAQLHDELPIEIAAKEARLAELDAKIEKNERLAARALEKAAANEGKADKTLKNVALYEQRSQKARQEREREESILQNLQLHRRKEEERLEATRTEGAHFREQVLNEAQMAADALLAEEQQRGLKEALRITEEVSRRLEEQLLTNGQKALLKVERERDGWRTAFELLRDAVNSIVPFNLYQKVKKRFTRDWSKHSDNPDCQPDPPHPPYSSGSFSP